MTLMKLVKRHLDKVRFQARELQELGLRGTLFRLRYEASARSGLAAWSERIEPPPTSGSGWTSRLPFLDEIQPGWLQERVPVELRDALVAAALRAAQGRILAFSRWEADFGSPPRWHQDPISGARWPGRVHWTRAMRANKGDIKLVWEIARFPHAFTMARAARFAPEHGPSLASGLADQVDVFLRDNPYAQGVHWASGQEIAFRLLAWVFAARTLLADRPATLDAIAHHVWYAAHHIAHHIDYARVAIHNNHILSEALGLLVAGVLFPSTPAGRRWSRFGRELLDEQIPRQFYPDGGYIQQSHTYHRIALHDLVTASLIVRNQDGAVPSPWLEALDRSVLFLHALQNPSDGRLPNYGPNDGGLPLVLSTCDYADFRPVLQVASLLTRGQRLYEPGPWDEEAAWLLGQDSLDAPQVRVARRPVSFGFSGHHVLRCPARDDTFAAFRCGDVHDRFGQIDMLHLDVWWRGHNVLVDGGSYLYNGPQDWHQYFLRTGSHNTVTVDRRDQMLHFRRFKTLYPTRADLLRLEISPGWQLVVGEHRGYARHPGSVVHRRSVLLLPDDLWVVVDQLRGTGNHTASLHWLAGAFAHQADAPEGRLTIQTPSGAFHAAVKDEGGRALEADVVKGRDHPPRGWQSRYYGEKAPVPSLVVTRSGAAPLTFVTVLSGMEAEVSASAGHWTIRTSDRAICFRLADGGIEDPTMAPA
jgi:hypothetical protein